MLSDTAHPPHRLGLLTLSLAVGEIVQEPTVPPDMFPAEFRDFLRRCLDNNERERWASKELLEHKASDDHDDQFLQFACLAGKLKTLPPQIPFTPH